MLLLYSNLASPRMSISCPRRRSRPSSSSQSCPPRPVLREASMKFCWCALLLLLFAPPAFAAERPTAALDFIVAEALKAWPAPGLALAVVRDDEVIYLKGGGAREQGNA